MQESPISEISSPLSPVPTLGGHIQSDGRVRFEVWAPHAAVIDVCVPDAEICQTMQAGEHGIHTAMVADVRPDACYGFAIRKFTEATLRSIDPLTDRVLPDPASRYQPTGVHGLSQLTDLCGYPWQDQHYRGVAKRDLVIYEMHIGAFTPEGTYTAAITRLDSLVDLGVTAVELMPLAQCAGRWNWGYDGVNLFAPSNSYGTPQDLCRFIDACHTRNLAVILDVVYNHLGPEGNYLAQFAPYFASRYPTPWGETLDFELQPQVRRFVLENVVHWLQDFHFDGLRLDAIHFLCDSSEPPITEDIRVLVRRLEAAAGRRLHLIGEANVHDAKLINGSANDYDAIWCDCLMHSLYAHHRPGMQVTNRGYAGGDELSEVLQTGYLYHAENGRPRRTANSIRKSHSAEVFESFIVGLQTHDCVGNHPAGKRLHQLTSREYQLAAAPLAILSPGIPQIFMGEEEALNHSFAFFVDFTDPWLNDAVTKGRAAEYPDQTDAMLLPIEEATFRASQYPGSGKTDTAGNDTSGKDTDMQGTDEHIRRWYIWLLSVRRAARELLRCKNLTANYDASLELASVDFTDDTERLAIRSRLCREGTKPRQLGRMSIADLPGGESATDLVLFSSLSGRLPSAAETPDAFYHLQPWESIVALSPSLAEKLSPSLAEKIERS
ncbi:MAG TPA: malto-oligosyltrehalose trehalohydrolase [Planctomycetaceae bacterium]|nr:malto-oligosyltrehalose trehalohydrolase [Planctomycetaceae bacterium]